MAKERLSACIVLYNSGDTVMDTLASLEAANERVDVYIVDNSPGDGVADKIQVMLLSTDTTKAPQERVVKQSTKVGLYTALDFGCIWLERALRDAAGKK